VMGGLSLGFSEKLIMRFGPRNILIPGFILVTIALLLFARTPVGGNYLTDLLPPFLLIAVGIGTSFPGIMTLAMSGATPQDAGLASGLVNTSMQVGGAVGLAVLATLSTERTANLEAAGHSAASALTSGYHLAYLVGAGLAFASVLIAIFVLKQEPRPEVGKGPAGDPAEAPAEREPAAVEG
jgi:MFS family permease